MDPKPFVKWAGGKTQLMKEIVKHVPSKFNKFIEPFVGGGAVLFKLSHIPSLINDSNDELINCYQIIKKKPEELIVALKLHKNDKEHFLKVRKQSSSDLTDVERAARFIFLNRTCFNGLWRVNKKNQFNTPFGNYKNPKIVNTELLRAVSIFLKEVKISNEDFESFLLKNAKKGDFIYFDPPYHPVGKYSDFKRYTKDFFGKEEQIKLSQLFIKLDKRGCKLLLSNSYSDFIIDLYSKFKIETVLARRNINKDPNGRGQIKEILVKNYD